MQGTDIIVAQLNSQSSVHGPIHLFTVYDFGLVVGIWYVNDVSESIEDVSSQYLNANLDLGINTSPSFITIH